MVTNFLEAEVAKLERRVRRIDEHPDPTKLRANSLLYRIELDRRREQLEAQRRGDPFAYTMVTEEILELMNLHCFPLSPTADRAAPYAEEYLTIARQHGVTENICDRYRVILGMILGGALPWPAVVTGASGACTVEMQMMVAAAQHCKVPSYVMDRYIEPDGERLPFLVQQTMEMIDFVERNVPGVKKFSMDALGERLAAEGEAQKCLQVLYRAAQQTPCPVRGQDMLRIPRISNAVRPGGMEYFHTLADEVGERAAKGYGALKEEKARAMWLVTSVFFDDVMSILEERGVAVPIFVWDNMAKTYGIGEGAIGFTETLGTGKVSPLEDYLRMISAQAWAGPAERWVQVVIDRAREFKIDMVIYFQLSGCPTNLLEARIVSDRVEKELGIPTLMIDGYMMDKAKYSKEEFRSKLNEFVDYVFQRMGIK